MRSSLYLALAGLALAVQTAGAQGACDDINRFFKKPPKLGEWAELRMDRDQDEGRKPTTMRVAFVDREEQKGRPMYRMQLIMTREGGQRQVMQMLTPWGADALSGEYDTELVMKMGDQPAVVMPLKGGQDQVGSYDIRKKCQEISFVGEEEVTVPAGTFEARHYTGPDGDSWVSPEVPGWRMVKMVTKKGHTMVLTGMGTDQKNEITEQPVDMRGMMNPMKRPKSGDKGEEAK